MILPIALGLKGRRCLVVGSGAEAERRVHQLLAVAADVLWVTGSAPATMAAPRIEERPFQESDLLGAWLVILADTNAELAERIGRACEAQQTLFCAIDQPTHNSFSHMALVHAPPVTLAIATEGQAPALARRLQRLLGDLFTPEVLAFFARLVELRKALPSGEERKTRLSALSSNLGLSGGFQVPAAEVDVTSPDQAQGSSKLGPEPSGSGGG
jgi:precorrin-2 dehydrogenase / sirohydrochlorin ferrochelatase